MLTNDLQLVSYSIVFLLAFCLECVQNHVKYALSNSVPLKTSLSAAMQNGMSAQLAQEISIST